jgi:CelD/BcsL family acetyltransferase involved in cellulose biosynthesis
MQTLSTSVVSDLAGLERYSRDWDNLAVVCGRPFCSPAWTIAHGRALLDRNASIRTVLVWQEHRLVGVAPYYLRSHFGRYAEYRLLGSEAHRIGPLAVPGLFAPVCSALAEALAGLDPAPSLVRLEGVDSSDGWAEELAHKWADAKPLVRRESLLGAPVVNLTEASFTDWLAAKSSNFRQSTRRLRRALAADGATFRMTSRPDELDSDVDKLIGLHKARWQNRGGSAALRNGVPELLKSAGRELLPEGRFRLWLLEAHGHPIAAQLFLAAGGELAYWNGGFDQRFARTSPALLTLLAALEDSFDRGESRLDLGGGISHYKQRIADDDAPVVWDAVLPRTRGYVLARSRSWIPYTQMRCRKTIRKLLPESTGNRLKQAVGRVARH